MLRALSTRRSYHGYERLLADESAIGLLEGNLKRSKTLPSGLRRFHVSNKLPSELAFPSDPKVKPAAARKSNKSHPLLSLFDSRRKKKTTARPELTRYIEYVKEGGTWDASSNVPVIHYK
ncbi:uncharacterized protein LOC8273372 [Ricinus communis]|uniref:uncharacterized protein LOC8273372 n=1 Tax=Ricinus communis TaxID=3988 RepID=UPI00201A8893|nr:uncharacterized protein LOC8273372 [Ricinus communis]